MNHRFITSLALVVLALWSGVQSYLMYDIQEKQRMLLHAFVVPLAALKHYDSQIKSISDSDAYALLQAYVQDPLSFGHPRSTSGDKKIGSEPEVIEGEIAVEIIKWPTQIRMKDIGVMTFDQFKIQVPAKMRAGIWGNNKQLKFGFYVYPDHPYAVFKSMAKDMQEFLDAIEIEHRFMPGPPSK